MTGRKLAHARNPFAEFAERALSTSGPAFYFERGPSPGRSARWAIHGFDPEERTLWTRPGDPETLQSELREDSLHRKHRIRVGYVGFDAVGLFEPLLARSTPKGSPFPLAEFHSYDHWKRSEILGRSSSSPPLPLGDLRTGPVKDRATPATFGASVERLIEEILDGEAFQVVLAHRRERSLKGTLLPLVDRLRRKERYAYLYYLRGGRRGEIEIAGASPESVVEVAEGHVAVSPIAGTRPYPPPPSGPRARLPLRGDPKELAEHRMLVDLARNDIGRVAATGSVHLSRLEVRVPYSRLEHLVTRVVGRLAPERTALDALAAAFPAGTVSGAPKIRATELLRREEGTWRGPYGGAVGFFQGTRRGEFALAIRSAFATQQKVFTGAGAGIVHASSPRREWEETLVKLSAVEGALVGRPGFR